VDNSPPTIGLPHLAIAQGATTTLTLADLAVTDSDDILASIEIAVTELFGGRFVDTSEPDVALTTFSLAEVEAGNIRFIHDGSDRAPRFSITATDGEGATTGVPADCQVDFTPEFVPIYILAGQSNAGLIEDDIFPQALEAGIERSYVYVHGARGGIPLASREADPEAHLLAEQLGLDWDPDSSGELYEALLIQARDAIDAIQAAGSQARVAGILWIQGERDAFDGQAAANYQTNLVAFIDRLRSDLADLGAESPDGPIPFVLAELASRSLPYLGLVRNAQVAVASQREAVHILDADDIEFAAGSLHYSAYGGEQIAERFLRALSGVPGVGPESIDRLRTNLDTITDSVSLELPRSGPNEHIVLGDSNDLANGNDGDDLVFGGPGDDILTGDEGDDILDGGDGLDTLTGGNGRDVIKGRSDNDLLRGGDGDDFLFGGDGRDRLFGDDGDDLIRGGTGADRLNGGAGRDTVAYSLSAEGISVNLATFQASGGDANGDRIWSIENVMGSRFDDTVAGDEQCNLLYGLAGDDTLLGGASLDRLYGGAGADHLDGGTSFDYAHYQDSTSGVWISLTSGQGSKGDAEGDSLVNIEGLVGSYFDDRLTGNDANNRIIGLDGADTLSGEDGDDQLNGGAGADILDGGDGRDRASYQHSRSAVSIDLSTGSASGGEAFGDRLIDIEELEGSRYGDTLRGDHGNNILWGLGGADMLFGDAGQDRLHGGDGSDLLDGGDGFDFAHYQASGSGIVADLNLGTVIDGTGATDRLFSIEGIYGSHHADIITGDNNANVLKGNGGNDTLAGGGGDDRLAGGNGSDTFRFVAGDGRDVVDDFDLLRDRIDLTDLGVTFDALQISADTARHALIDLSDTDSILLLHIAPEDLTQDMFLL